MNRSAAIKKQLLHQRQEAIALFQKQGVVDALLQALTKNVDQALTQLWSDLLLPPELALVGVGGYGRGELFPYSDVDVLILLDTLPTAQMQEQIEKVVHLFWDMGLEIGHSIRTIDECLIEAASDITIQTSLLDARWITGSHHLFQQLQKKVLAAIDPRAFFQAKILEMRQRHIKYEDTPYSLEPNCKESPGGLRDLQIIAWVSKAAGLGDSWEQLGSRGLMTDTEVHQLKQKESAFKDIRIRLHLCAGRREDRLLFDVQTSVAQTLGFQNTETRRASEYLMQRYYWAAKAVTQLNTILLQNIDAQLFPKSFRPRVINERFNEMGGLLDIARDDVFESHPSAILEAFLLLVQHPELSELSARTLRALWHVRLKIDESFRNNLNHRALFLSIMQAPQGVTRALRRMNRTGILGRYLPSFRRIVGQMQHDLFHVYTVDQHILMVVRNLRRFMMAEYAHEYPFCSRLIANFSQPWVLYVAALFHDIAKGRGGDHSELGGQEAQIFCREHGLSVAETELIVFLVEQHLTMSHVAQKKDLSDPAVIQSFAALVQNERRLTALYLLTVADIRGTSPKVWNAWKGQLLEDLYYLTIQALGNGQVSFDHELKNRQEQAMIYLNAQGISDEQYQSLWAELDVAYFLRHDAFDIAWQTQALYEQMNSQIPVIQSRSAPVPGSWYVMVYVKDQADLFARIGGYFERTHWNILDAKIHTTRHGYALDTFLIVSEYNSSRFDSRLEQELAGLLTSKVPLPAPRKIRLSRLSRAFPITPTVDLRPDEKKQYYLLSITANDRRGLLYAIVRVLAQEKIRVHTAKIMTLGERVEDVFLIEGDSLNSERHQIQLETDLLSVLRVHND